jgi:hypothetical protein
MVGSQTRYRTAIAALLFLLVGVLFLVLSANVFDGVLSVLSAHVGSFVIASVAMALIFEFWQLRALLDDLFAQIRAAEQIKEAGLTGFTVSFHDRIPWEDLFNESNRLDVVVAYARTWRNTHERKLRDFLDDPDAILEVVLPDPGFDLAVGEMAHRFELEKDELVRRIQQAKEWFEQLGNRGRGEVRVYYLRRALVYSMYRFNNKCIVASYRHRPERGEIVTVMGERGGSLYKWTRDEWYGMVRGGVESGLTEQVHPRLVEPEG